MPMKTTCDRCAQSLNTLDNGDGIRLDIPPDEFVMPCSHQFHVRCLLSAFMSDSDAQALVQIPGSVPVPLWDVHSVDRNGEIILTQTPGTHYLRKVVSVKCPNCGQGALTNEWEDTQRTRLAEALRNSNIRSVRELGEVYADPNDRRHEPLPEAQLVNQRQILVHDSRMIWLRDGLDKNDLAIDGNRIMHLPTWQTFTPDSNEESDSASKREQLAMLLRILDLLEEQFNVVNSPNATPDTRVMRKINNTRRWIGENSARALQAMIDLWGVDWNSSELPVPGRPGRTVAAVFAAQVQLTLERAATLAQGEEPQWDLKTVALLLRKLRADLVGESK
ncbi:hypothetical protein [Amycolatopsis sp. cmx-4-61]|uniref:hypothetical protein n=1 Tax=Amycolatopsis sp. cmx-4-61 TaxID=2790937 RepID=UPI00397D1363